MKTLRKKRMDTWFLATILIIALGGFLIFLSASTGMLARENINFPKVIISQSIALILGLGLLFLFSHIHYRFWRKYAFFILIAVFILSLLVFIPGLGFSHGGATRWLSLGPFNLQPAAFLQLGFIIYCSAWLSGITSKIHKFSFGLLPMLIILSVIALILLLQRDTGSLVIIATTGFAMFFVAGAKWKDILILVSLGFSGIAVLSYQRPYIYERFLTLLNRAISDTQGSGYQINQSLIAIGSGEWFGRGFGQSVQKFRFLPEASTDSIFAVAAEELGFIGALFIITLFLMLAWRGMRIATKAPDCFARLLVVGIVIMFTTQAFIHMGGMLNILPLSGTPLSFISLGGTSLMVSLASVGIILNVSRYTKLK